MQLGLLAKTGVVSYSGFTLTVELNELIDRTLMSCLHGESYQIVEGTPAYPGVVEAPLIGGNLSLLTSLIGTPYQPNFKGSILLLEDVEIEPFNVNRMISHLDLAGVFDQVVGIIFGEFEHCISRDPQCGTVEDVINEWSLRFKVPCLKNFPIIPRIICRINEELQSLYNKVENHDSEYVYTPKAYLITVFNTVPKSTEGCNVNIPSLKMKSSKIKPDKRLDL